MVKLQGTSKTVSELEDICSALKKHSETDSMSMFFGTSEMILQSPVYHIESGICNDESISSRFRVLEESVYSLIALAKISADKPTPNTIQTNKVSDIPAPERLVSQISEPRNLPGSSHVMDLQLQGLEGQLTERSSTSTCVENVMRTRAINCNY